jgi:hypothetical protein
MVFKRKAADAPGTNVSLALRVGVTDNVKLEVPLNDENPGEVLLRHLKLRNARTTICYIRTTTALASTSDL